MTESYELPVLFTDDECKAYAAWGMKKEKVLMPFALITTPEAVFSLTVGIFVANMNLSV